MRIIPAEWESIDAIWTAWPSHPELWLGERLQNARQEIAGMIEHLYRDQQIHVLAFGDEAEQSAKQQLGSRATVHQLPFGDLWLRDTGPIFAFDDGKLVALRFLTNGWGGKFVYEFDDQVGDSIASLAGTPTIKHPFVLEGGSIEHNGQGTLLTTKECILNPNRNPGWSQSDAEEHLKAAFAAKRVVWLTQGLINDHTDGHIDNIARFVGENRVVCQKAFGQDDPNSDIYRSITEDLRRAGFDVVEITSPGRVTDDDGEIVPASHMNFVIGNRTVVVPTYGTESVARAISELQAVFPGRKVLGSSSKTVLTGGGSFHCITQQQAKARV